LLQNSELFTLTYGALVSQLLKDYENVDDVNKQLERMGYNIGIRLIEDFLARTSSGRCYDFRDTADKIQVRQENAFYIKTYTPNIYKITQLVTTLKSLNLLTAVSSSLFKPPLK